MKKTYTTPDIVVINCQYLMQGGGGPQTSGTGYWFNPDDPIGGGGAEAPPMIEDYEETDYEEIIDIIDINNQHKSMSRQWFMSKRVFD